MKTCYRAEKEMLEGTEDELEIWFVIKITSFLVGISSWLSLRMIRHSSTWNRRGGGRDDESFEVAREVYEELAFIWLKILGVRFT